MSRIFICHSSDDKEIVRKIKRDLLLAGIQTWLDEDEIKVGDSLREKIEQALVSCRFAIVVLSESSIKKPWVSKELNALFSMEIEENRKLILPIVIDSVKVPAFLKDKKYADFTGDYSAGLDELKRSIMEPNSIASSYEALKCDITMHIKRLDGSLVFVEKIHRIRVLDENLDKFRHAVSSDGKVEGLNSNPGTIVNTWKESGITYADIEFPAPLQQGDVIDSYFCANYIDSFTGDTEYWDQMQFIPSREFSLKINFLAGRAPTNIIAYEKRGSDTFDESKNLSITKINNNTIVRFEKIRPILHSIYTIKWEW